MSQEALNQAFEKEDRKNEVLYYLPITQQWIFQLILALILICHCSYRGIKELRARFVGLSPQYWHDSQQGNGSSAKSPKYQSNSRFIVN